MAEENDTLHETDLEHERRITECQERLNLLLAEMIAVSESLASIHSQDGRQDQRLEDHETRLTELEKLPEQTVEPTEETITELLPEAQNQEEPEVTKLRTTRRSVF